jgi:hypothetical protein
VAKLREKTINYRRAMWLSGGRSLESYIREAVPLLPTVSDRTYLADSGRVVKLLSIDPRTRGWLLHVSAETPGEAASIVPDAGARKSINVSTWDAPNSTEYMDGDAFAYVVGDHVCMCTSTLHDVVVYDAMLHLFSLAKITADSQRFDLIRVANADKLKMIHGAGIKSIDLQSTLFKASLDYSRRHAQTQGLVGWLSKQLKALFGKPDDVTNDSLQVKLIIKKDRRVRQHLTLGEKRLEFLAENLILNQESDDHFSIVLDNDQIITQDEIYIRAKLPIPAKGKSVDRDEAWKSLVAFYNELLARGMLGQ